MPPKSDGKGEGLILKVLIGVAGFCAAGLLYAMDARVSKLESGAAIVMAPETRQALVQIDKRLDSMQSSMQGEFAEIKSMIARLAERQDKVLEYLGLHRRE